MKNTKIIKIFLIVGEVLMVMSMAIMSILYLLVSVGSAYKLENYTSPFVYVSFILSFLLLIISMKGKLNKFVQKNKAFSLILGVFLSFCYAAARVSVFPKFIQVEDIGTAIIILISFVVSVVKKKED